MNRLAKLYQRSRVRFYRRLWDIAHLEGEPRIDQPALLTGLGHVTFGQQVRLGYFPSPGFFSGYLHIEARGQDAQIEIADRTIINNNASLISEGRGGGIKIGADVLIGPGAQIADSDFHGLRPEERNTPSATAAVEIGDSVFLAANVTICKGVAIGSGSVIATGAVVTRSIPERVLAAGVPAKVVRALD